MYGSTEVRLREGEKDRGGEKDHGGRLGQAKVAKWPQPLPAQETQL